MGITAALAIALHIRRFAVTLRGMRRATWCVRFVAIPTTEAARATGRANGLSMFREGAGAFVLLLVDLCPKKKKKKGYSKVKWPGSTYTHQTLDDSDDLGLSDKRDSGLGHRMFAAERRDSRQTQTNLELTNRYDIA